MVQKNKWIAIFDEYRVFLQNKLKKKYKLNKSGLPQASNGNRSKNKILDFFLLHNRWPSETAKSKKEKN